MQQYQVYCAYQRRIQEWHNSIQAGHDPSALIPTFLTQIHNILECCITFDRRVVDCLLFSLLHSHLNSMHPTHLLAIAQQLYSIRFISKRELSEIIDSKEINSFQRGQEFLDSYNQLKSSQPWRVCEQAALSELWLDIMKIRLDAFWRLVLTGQLKYPLLIQMYEITCVCSEVKTLKHLEGFIKRLKSELDLPYRLSENSSNKKPSKINKPIEQIIQEKFSLSTKQQAQIIQEIVWPNPFREKPHQHVATFKKVISEQAARPEKRAQKSKPTFQEEDYPRGSYPLSKEEKASAAFRRFIQHAQSSSNELEKSLVMLAFQNSLFFNWAYEELLIRIHQFVDRMKEEFNMVTSLQLGLFGSLRSRLALVSDFDLDVTYIGNGTPISREEGLNLLEAVKIHLKDTNKLPWISVAYVLDKPKLPPLMQIKTNIDCFAKAFSLNLKKIDVTACNDYAAINSEFLSHFAQVPEINLFCLLVKLWAKRTNVIKRRAPIRGLSSYGVVLMCLYYLMETGQINFLQFSPQELQHITLGSLVPNIKVTTFRAFDDNFVGFMDFYREGGRFHRQNKVVCLLKGQQWGRHCFQPELIFNMYDFIDKTNPGKMDLQEKQSVLGQFQKAYYILRDRNLSVVFSMLTQDNSMKVFRRR